MGLPDEKLRGKFEKGLQQGGGEEGKVVVEKGKSETRLALRGKRSSTEKLRFRIKYGEGINWSFGTGDPLVRVLICGAANWRRHAEDGYREVTSSFAPNVRTLLWQFGSVTRKWKDEDATRIA